MKIENFIKSLLPTLEYDKVRDDLANSLKLLRTATIPALKQAELAFKAHDFKSAVYKDYWDTYRNGSGNSRQKNIIDVMLDGCERMEVALITIESMLDELFVSDAEAIGLTYRKANAIQLIAAGSFVAKYARKALLHIFVAESMEYQESGVESMTDSIPPAELDWLDKNIVNFFVILRNLERAGEDIKKRLIAVPDVTVTPNNVAIATSVHGEQNLDPLNMGFIPVVLNPIYHVQMLWVEYLANSYHAAKDELMLIQLRKLNLERLQAGKPDARIQKEIAALEGRISKLNQKIEKLENR